MYITPKIKEDFRGMVVEFFQDSFLHPFLKIVVEPVKTSGDPEFIVGFREKSPLEYFNEDCGFCMCTGPTVKSFLEEYSDEDCVLLVHGLEFPVVIENMELTKNITPIWGGKLPFYRMRILMNPRNSEDEIIRAVTEYRMSKLENQGED